MSPPARSRPAPAAAPELAAAPAPAQTPAPFWRTKTLATMTVEEWESLCDGCGRCCLVKLEDEDTGAIAYTDVACRLFDAGSCRCADYPNRSEIVEDCVRLTPEAVESIGWLPPTCAYRLVREGKDLPFWHPLVSGTRDTVVSAGISVQGRVAGLESAFGLFELVDHIANWPTRWPRGAKGTQAPVKPARARAKPGATKPGAKDTRA